MVLKRTRALISAKWQFRRRRNYMVLKLASVEKFGARGLETEEITGFSNRKGSFVLCYKYKEIVGHSNLVYVDCAGRTV